MEYCMKYEKLQKPILMILVSIFIFIMSNSVITNGHDVIRWSLSEIGIEYVYIQGDMLDNSYYNVDIVENYGYVYSLK